MFLKELKICNFRCFSNKNIDFENKINVLLGLNATGKTSILEAINYIGVSKSFKTTNDDEILMYGSDSMSVAAVVQKEKNTERFKIVKSPNGKSVYKNQFKFLKISDYLGEVLIVSFSSYDLVKLLGYSKDRRKIFEPIICQISNKYVIECNKYNKILNNRNSLLKRLSFEKNDKLLELLNVLNFQLVEAAKEIVRIRREFMLKVNERISTIHSKIASSRENLILKYKCNVLPDKMLNELESRCEYDLKKGTTSVGPHKDDFIFEIDGKDVGSFGSQGQQRNTLISAKIAFVKILKEEKKENPILLLDDVCSELDSIRQNNLFNLLDENMQVIISTATIAEVDKSIIEKANIITLTKEA